MQDRISFDEDYFVSSDELFDSVSITILTPNFSLCMVGFGLIVQLNKFYESESGRTKLDNLKSVTEMLLGYMSKWHVKECMVFKHPALGKFQLVEVCGKTFFD